MAQLRQHLDRIRSAGAELVVIGSGTPEMARHFQQQQAPDVPVYVDEERVSYQAAGLKSGVLRTLSPVSAIRSLRALTGGFTQGAIQGDPWQQGGVLVVLPSGKVVYRYASDEPGDHPPVMEILNALPPPGQD